MVRPPFITLINKGVGLATTAWGRTCSSSSYNRWKQPNRYLHSGGLHCAWGCSQWSAPSNIIRRTPAPCAIGPVSSIRPLLGPVPSPGAAHAPAQTMRTSRAGCYRLAWAHKEYTQAFQFGPGGPVLLGNIFFFLIKFQNVVIASACCLGRSHPPELRGVLFTFLVESCRQIL